MSITIRLAHSNAISGSNRAYVPSKVNVGGPSVFHLSRDWPFERHRAMPICASKTRNGWPDRKADRDIELRMDRLTSLACFDRIQARVRSLSAAKNCFASNLFTPLL
jgi:hypothetical protein